MGEESMLLSTNSTVDVVFTEFAGFDECILCTKVYIDNGLDWINQQNKWLVPVRTLLISITDFS